jgi:hypothetical protein
VSKGCILSNAIICNTFDLTPHCFLILFCLRRSQQSSALREKDGLDRLLYTSSRKQGAGEYMRKSIHTLSAELGEREM